MLSFASVTIAVFLCDMKHSSNVACHRHSPLNQQRRSKSIGRRYLRYLRWVGATVLLATFVLRMIVVVRVKEPSKYVCLARSRRGSSSGELSGLSLNVGRLPSIALNCCATFCAAL